MSHGLPLCLVLLKQERTCIYLPALSSYSGRCDHMVGWQPIKLVCGSCNNRVDFVKSSYGKSWAEDQADSFCFECRGCAKMKGLEVEMECLRQLVELVGREEVGCASGSGEGNSG